MNARIAEKENHPKNTAADAPDPRTEVKELKDEVSELRFYLDEELNKVEKKTAETLNEIKARITDAEEQIVIAQKTAEDSNTAADAPDLSTEIEKIKESLADIKGELSDVSADFNHEKEYTLKDLLRKVDKLEKTASYKHSRRNQRCCRVYEQARGQFFPNELAEIYDKMSDLATAINSFYDRRHLR